jgi:hypothetical protein
VAPISTPMTGLAKSEPLPSGKCDDIEESNCRRFCAEQGKLFEKCWVRTSLELYGVTGKANAVGAAGLVGGMRGKAPGLDIAFVLGLSIGVWLALHLRRK